MLKDMVEMEIEFAQYTKKTACADGPRDILPAISVVRGLDPVALILLRNHERDEILAAAQVAAAGFDADAIGLIFETYMAINTGDPDDDLVNINPLTDQQWGPGEMGDAAQNHGAIEKGWLREAICVNVVTRSEDIGFATLPYRYVSDVFFNTKQLHWDDEHQIVWLSTDPDRVGEIGGLMADVLLDALRKPSMSQVMPQGAAPIMRAKQDVMTAQVLQRHVACEVALFTDERQKARAEYLLRFGNRVD